ncbi:taste receptor type 2 member 7-like [Sus scrofa]|uniref:taste receptor type 2 member 7-like n=1 Tax=Sus scrofa TaxID=9823 RepID=UPI0001E87292|nr:taste receptor type 2 member 7-like [Sus scrofa]
MLNVLEKVFMTVTGGELIIGILGNGFIGLTTFIAWIRNQKLCLVDFILTSLAFARISQLWLTVANLFSVLLYQEGFGTVERNYVLASSLILANHLSIWLATCLVVFYFLKIASFSNLPFLWLKRRIKKVVFILLLLSVPFLFMSFPFPYSFDGFWYHTQNILERNITELYNVTQSQKLKFMLIFTAGSIPPFSLSLISFFLLLCSLWKHKKHIELSVSDSRDASMEAHFRAMRTVFFFLVFFALYHLAFFMTFGGHFLLQNKLVTMFGYMLGILYPSGHSYVIIFGNSQMRKAFLGILWHWKCGA